MSIRTNAILHDVAEWHVISDDGQTEFRWRKPTNPVPQEPTQ